MESQKEQVDYIGNIRNNFVMRLSILTILIMVVIFKGLTSGEGQISNSSFIVLLILNGFSIVFILIGFLYKKKRINSYKSGNLKSRLENFLLASKYLRSTMEAGVCLTAVEFGLSKNYIFVIETIVMYIGLICIFPTKKNIHREIEHEVDNV